MVDKSSDLSSKLFKKVGDKDTKEVLDDENESEKSFSFDFKSIISKYYWVIILICIIILIGVFFYTRNKTSNSDNEVKKKKPPEKIESFDVKEEVEKLIIKQDELKSKM